MEAVVARVFPPPGRMLFFGFNRLERFADTVLFGTVYLRFQRESRLWYIAIKLSR